jgi:hypothetical protein
MATEATPGAGTLTAAGIAPWAEGDQPTLTLSDVQYAPVSADALGANTLVAAVPAQRIRVLALVLVASGGANTVQSHSDAGGAALTAAMDLGDNRQMTLPYNPAGWCQTIGGESLTLDLAVATLVAGLLTYVLAG